MLSDALSIIFLVIHSGGGEGLEKIVRDSLENEGWWSIDDRFMGRCLAFVHAVCNHCVFSRNGLRVQL